MKFEGLANEIVARTGATYMAEAIIGLIIGLIFLYFSKVYQRHYLKTWAIAWCIFFMANLCLGIGAWYGYRQQDAFRFWLSFFSQAGIFLHVFFLLAGTLELTRSIVFRKNQLVLICILVLLVSLFMIQAYHSSVGDEAAQMRYLFRIVFRYCIVTLGFLTTWLLTIRSSVFSRGLGQRIFRISILLYSVTYGYYFIVGVANFTGSNFMFPFFFGMVELVLISAIGLGMIMWLLEDERERLNKINKELDSFLYSTSHDLRAPIASILGLTNLARIEITDENSKKFMGMIEDRVKKLDLVIGDILNLSRSKKVELKYEVVDFNKLLKETIADVKFNQNAPSISLDYQEDSENILKTDYSQLKIILANLISNAVKYHNIHQPKPIIKVEFKRSGRLVKIEVEDNGQGIPKESLPKIFEMFYRASTTVDGTGLGLYIVKEATAKLGGKISAKSEFGKGSTFSIVLENV